MKEEFKNGKGTIYFMPRQDATFTTYDFNGGNKRFHPTFEAQRDVSYLFEKLETYRRNRVSDL